MACISASALHDLCVRCTLWCVRRTLACTVYAVNPEIRAWYASRREGVTYVATNAKSDLEPRARLTRERVQRAAIVAADAGGLEALTMRKLADVLEVAPMALYRHVANKDD